MFTTKYFDLIFERKSLKNPSNRKVTAVGTDSETAVEIGISYLYEEEINKKIVSNRKAEINKNAFSALIAFEGTSFEDSLSCHT